MLKPGQEVSLNPWLEVVDTDLSQLGTIFWQILVKLVSQTYAVLDSQRQNVFPVGTKSRSHEKVINVEV
jgi:hypothetical protein